jgi:uncharacterized protein (DUF2236 family)
VPPLTPSEREQYYAEARRLAGLFGLPSASLPPRWADFAAYAEAMLASDTLAVSNAARLVARQIFDGGGTFLRVPTWYRAVTARLLPERFREPFGFAYGEEEQRAAERALAWARRCYPLLPPWLRFVGPYQEARQRLAGRRCGIAIGTANRFWIGQPRMPGGAGRGGK